MKASNQTGNSLRNRLFSITMNEYLVLLIVFSAFVSVFFLGVLILLLPLYMLLTKQLKLAIPKNKKDYLILLFSVMALLSTYLFTRDADLNGFLLKREYLILLGIGLILLCFDIFFFSNIMTKRAFRWALKLSSVLSLTSFVVALIQAYFKIYASPARVGRYASVFINENYYGMMIVFSVIITLYCLFQTNKTSWKIFFCLILAANFAGLWLCESRTAFVVVALSIVIFFLFYRIRFGWILLAVLLLFCLCIVKYPTLLPRLDETSENLDFRLGIWNSAIQGFLNSPILGNGFYSYSNIWHSFGEMKFYAMHAHNLYLEIFLNFGILGAGFLFLYVGNLLKRCVQNCRKAKNPLHMALVISTVSAIAIHSAMDITLFWPQTGFMAVLLLAIPEMYHEESEALQPEIEK